MDPTNEGISKLPSSLHELASGPPQTWKSRDMANKAIYVGNKRSTAVAVEPTTGDVVRQFGKGLFDGVAGLVVQPMKGAKKGGFLGGLKGVGTGLAGLVMKPVSGTVGLVSSSLAGVEAQLGASKTYTRKML